jgi:hypothetical protein
MITTGDDDNDMRERERDGAGRGGVYWFLLLLLLLYVALSFLGGHDGVRVGRERVSCMPTGRDGNGLLMMTNK